MLQVYTSVNQTVDENSPVAFNITKISTGCTSALTNSNTITLRKSGFYEVSFNGTGVTTAAEIQAFSYMLTVLRSQMR